MPASPVAVLQTESHPSNVASAASSNETGVGGGGVKRFDDTKGSGPESTLLAIDLAQIWLAWQCRMIAGIIRGALYQPVDAKHIGSVLAIWPGEGEGEKELLDVATQALSENRGLIRPQQRYGPGGHRVCDMVASPLVIENETVAVVGVMISPRSEPQQQAVLQLLQWGGLWMEIMVRQQQSVKQQFGAFDSKLLTRLVGHSSSHAAAIDTVNQLAERFSCERVSLGFHHGKNMRLAALSHVASFDPRTQLVRRIEAAMAEAADQKKTLVVPVIDNYQDAVTRAQRELAVQQGNHSVCTIPLSGRSRVIGAITLERDASQTFDTSTIGWIQSIASILGPLIESKRQEERSFFAKGGEALLSLGSAVFGPSRLKFKMILLTLIVAVSILAVIDGDYRVTAPASIEGEVRQVIAAPQAGFIRKSEVRPGDQVKKGQLIAAMDDRDLRLTRQKWQSERNKIEKEYQEALAMHDRIELSLLSAQIDQVEAEIQLLEEKISRTKIRAPFDGVIVSGDLTQSLGAPLEIGQLLFEIAPLERYRVVLEVDEHDVADLKSGRTGKLIFAALPDKSFSFSLGKLIPVAVSSETRNHFQVEATLNEHLPLLRPGMRGVGKIDIGRRNLFWIWTHSMVDRIRLWIWSVGF